MTGARAAGDRLSDEALLAGLAVGDPDVAVVFVRLLFGQGTGP